MTAERDEPEDEFDFDDDDDEDGPQTEVTIEVTGLSLYTHHGVSAAEREVGQRLVLDLRLEVGEADATVTDLVEHTVDYGAVCERVALVAQQRSYRTLERLCSAVADRLLEDFEAEEVWVKATKPEPRSRCPWSPSRSRCGDSAGSRGGGGLRRGHGGRAGGRRARRRLRGRLLHGLVGAARSERRLPRRDRAAGDAGAGR